MKKGIVVLSLFDGMSCGQIAFDKLGIKFDSYNERERESNLYFASEIKTHAIKTTQHNYPNTIQIGDVTKVSYKDGILYTENGKYNVGKIDYLIGGSPCQNFSQLNAQNGLQTGLEGEKSKLFYEYLRLKNEINPTYFLLENVKMKKESKIELDEYLKTEGFFINAIDFSYQSRPRYYWTNIDFNKNYVPKNVNFQNYKDTDFEYCDKFKLNKTTSREQMWNNGLGTIKGERRACANITYANKIACVTTKQDRSPNSGLIAHGNFCRFLTQRELELAQTVPIGYTNCISYNQACNLLGDGWCVDVIVHLLKNSIK